jgi:RNA polymerase sigma-70 factor (ECF subfamily)
MRNQEIENQIDFLLSAALNKCGNLEDAQDLTQDTLLAALTYLSNGNPINDIRGWLLTVLNRKFYYKLRQKYKISIVSIGEETELTDETDYYESIGNSDEAESLRRAVAHLSKLHREVIVRYYMNRDSIEKIARELGTPQGTVKSRL